jgi:hypothetical protein
VRGGTAREHTSGVHGANRAFTFNLRETLRQFENQYILRALDQAGQDRKEAAKLLDISLSSPQDRGVGDYVVSFLEPDHSINQKLPEIISRS